MRGKWLAAALLTILVVSAILTTTNLRMLDIATQNSSTDLDSSASGTALSDEWVHVCMCSDDPDFRPAVVSIRSAVASAVQPERLVFHFITTPELEPRFWRMAKIQLPGIRVEIHSDVDFQDAIQSRISFRETSGRKVLASAFNFAPFYLPHFLRTSSETFNDATKRLLYIDADTLLLGDLGELFDMDLQGKPCAAVPYCNQRLEHYINFDVLRAQGYTGIDPNSCIANRGLVLIDVKVWTQLKITESIEKFLEAYRIADKDLWVSGMSQPPWLLAMNGNYARLGEDWNCNSLGRSSMDKVEADQLMLKGFTKEMLQTLRVQEANRGLSPYVVTCSSEAKLLHYNGAMKPWLLDSDTIEVPVCTIPKNLVDYNYHWMQDVLVSGRQNYTFVTCAEIWSLYLSDDLLAGPTDHGQDAAYMERQEDARKWANKITKDRERQEQERIARKKREAELRKKLAGGFVAGQQITAAHDISVRGKVVVRKGCKGVVQGASANHPLERLNVLFKERRDKKIRSINVLPFEVRELPKEEKDKAKDKEAEKDADKKEEKKEDADVK
eukprot:TRINITY_DN10370_c0_g2_i2.p1 TRINITY_DN10370_c0_g2~~TRINITY_DN10370_c0_g2_i2.p1  ORF type:complete len:556 (+),score=106.81 TRINITY_DN10370_c0_g2_i2:103-1770(+)